MRKFYGLGLGAVMLATALIASAASAQAFGPRRFGGGIVPPAVFRMIPPQQVHSIIAADKQNLMTLHQALRAAHEQLVQDLVNGKDTANDITALETARNNLLQEKVKLANQILSNLSSSQRTQLASFLQQWSTLQQTQRQQRMQLFQQLGSDVTTP